MAEPYDPAKAADASAERLDQEFCKTIGVDYERERSDQLDAQKFVPRFFTPRKRTLHSRFFVSDHDVPWINRLKLVYLVPLNVVALVPLIFVLGCLEYPWRQLLSIPRILRTGKEA